jgi:hypothetical protein
MKKLLPICGALTLGALVSTSFATSASSLSSFGGIEEPAVIYVVSSKSFKSDSFKNITEPSSGTFQMYLRFNKSQWDGDRTTTSDDRQRAEVKVLGPRQKMGETYEYTSSWRTDSGFKAGSRFCHVTQVKAYDGSDTGSPLVTTTIKSGSSVEIAKCSHDDSGLSAVRTLSYTPGSFMTVKIRLKTSTSTSGELRASKNGDTLSGKTGIKMYRQGANEYQPKWGLYRGCDTGQSFGNDYIEHKTVSANKI